MGRKVIHFISDSQEKTKKIGEELARSLKAGDIIALHGDLGSGKTCITKGIARGLKIDENHVKSPSFTLINEYHGVIPLFHFDLFRLNAYNELDDLGCEEYIYGDGVTVIEWAEKMERYLPKKRINIYLTIISDNLRSIEICHVC